MIVISKVNPDDLEEDDVVKKVKKIKQLNMNLTESCKSILDAIVKSRRVFIFPYPNYMNPDKVN